MPPALGTLWPVPGGPELQIPDLLSQLRTVLKGQLQNSPWSQLRFLLTFYHSYTSLWVSQVVQWYRTCLLMQETQEMWIQSLGQGDPLK